MRARRYQDLYLEMWREDDKMKANNQKKINAKQSMNMFIAGGSRAGSRLVGSRKKRKRKIR